MPDHQPTQRKQKHATASTFVYDFSAGGTAFRLLLLWHPKFDRWMIPGGHVESWENCAEAALREVEEETQLGVRLIERDRPVEDLVAGLVPQPWAIVEQQIPAQPREPAHVHVDHLFVATPQTPGRPPVGARWVAMEELDELEMFEDTRRMARAFSGPTEEALR
jgi:8-oxo-dGTP pyrophosphatase MutT (NUDIX family)